MFVALLALTYVAGAFISLAVFLYRAGLTTHPGVNWREFLLPNIPFFVLCYAKMLVWGVVLLVWLGQGCPASPWRSFTRVNGREVRLISRTGRAPRVDVSRQETGL